MASIQHLGSKVASARLGPSRSLLAPLVSKGRAVISSTPACRRQPWVVNPAIARRDLRMHAMSGSAAGSGMSPELKRSIDEFIAANKVVVFMKGTKQAPQCGFSARVVQILTVMEAKFETVNILEDDRLRSGMKEYSQWPTFPQVYINGEFYGGADIIMEAAQNGQLKEALEVALME